MSISVMQLRSGFFALHVRRFVLAESTDRIDASPLAIYSGHTAPEVALTVLNRLGTLVLITQTAEYALRAVVYLADQRLPQTTSVIAEHTHVPLGYLSKVMQGLSRAGLVHSQRGLHGGFALAFPTEELTVLQVINAVEPIRRYHECPLGLHGKQLCPLHRKLDDAAKSIEETFRDTSIADLNNVPKSRKPLCAFPNA